MNTASAYKSLCLSNPAATVETNSFWDRKPFAGNKKKQNLKIIRFRIPTNPNPDNFRGIFEC